MITDKQEALQQLAVKIKDQLREHYVSYREHYVSYSDLAKIQADLDEQKRQNLILIQRFNTLEKLYHEHLLGNTKMLPNVSKTVLEALTEEPTTAKDLCTFTGYTLKTVRAAILDLRQRGLVVGEYDKEKSYHGRYLYRRITHFSEQ